MKKFTKAFYGAISVLVLTVATLPLSACSGTGGEELVLRVSSWEEYIDLGDWDDEELIDITNDYNEEAGGVIGINSMVDDFTEWFDSLGYDFKVRVEYSTFGTNEDLYNRLNLGDVYDLVCPSDYMIMKLIDEGRTRKFSESFRDTEIVTNHYVNCVSPYIDGVFEAYDWEEYAACYMWGTTGIVYNPELVEDTAAVSGYDILKNNDFYKKVTVKDNVRDAYFAALGILNKEELMSDNVTDEKRSELLNATDDEAIASALNILKEIKDNVYSFETDSGKSDMLTGKIAANFQWSGDAVYIMDGADSDENNPTELWYSVPDECTNLWFDGWVMLEDGIRQDERKQIAAEAFVNFISRPDNAIRNMYYIGYTSAIADDMVFEYFDWNYGVILDPSDEEYDNELSELVKYDVNHFFARETDDEYYIYVDLSQLEVDTDNLTPSIEKVGTDYGNDKNYNVYAPQHIDRGRQAFAQYPPQSVIARSVVMLDFKGKLSDINQMWINVRCLDVLDFDPAVVWSVVGLVFAGAVAITLYKFRYNIFIRRSSENA